MFRQQTHNLVNPDGTTNRQNGIVMHFVNFEQTDLLPQKFWPTSSYTAQASLSGSIYGELQNMAEDLYGEQIFTNQKLGVLSIPRNLFGDYIITKISIKIITDSGSYFDDGEGRLQMSTPSSSVQDQYYMLVMLFTNMEQLYLQEVSRKEGTGCNRFIW